MPDLRAMQVTSRNQRSIPYFMLNCIVLIENCCAAYRVVQDKMDSLAYMNPATIMPALDHSSLGVTEFWAKTCSLISDFDPSREDSMHTTASVCSLSCIQAAVQNLKRVVSWACLKLGRPKEAASQCFSRDRVVEHTQSNIPSFWGRQGTQ